MKFVKTKFIFYISFLLVFIVSCAKQSNDDGSVDNVENTEFSSGVRITASSNINNLAPSSEITRPSLNVTVTRGNSFTFKGQATDPDGDTSLTLLWDFGGYTLNSYGSTKTVVFDRLGQVNVTLKVKDSLGLWDPTPAKIKVLIVDAVPAPVIVPDPDPIVVPVSPPIVVQQNLPPQGQIVSPSIIENITEGDSVVFLGLATDPEAGVVSYLWDFDQSGIVVSALKSPGRKKFTKAGVFKVSLVVVDDIGLRDPTPSIVTINVAAKINVVSSLPNGIIVSPITDIVLTVGDSYTFKASATDQNNVAGMLYYWDFDGYVLSAVGKNKTVVFDAASTIKVSLKVKNSTGLWDKTPAIVNVIVKPANLNVPPQITNAAPESYITAPAYNYIIPKGDSIFFSGNGIDPEGDLNLDYYWSFDGVIDDSIAQIPGAIIFDRIGFYTIEFTVTDSQGLADSSAAITSVLVTDVSAANISPDSIIKSPPSNVTINIGESLRFIGEGLDVGNNAPLSFLWDFDGALPNTSAQNPGDVTFNLAGIYRVSLNVMDAQGNIDTTPAVKIVTVKGNTAQTIPNGEIISPEMNQMIEVGDSLLFEGNVYGATGLEGKQFYYQWNFDGVIPNSIMEKPGIVTFANAGIYNISLRVTNSAGVKDPTPAAIQIEVKNTQAVNEAPNGLIASPNSNIIIYVGDSINFIGLGIDSDSDVLGYFWDFDGAAPNEQVQSPGIILFETAGVYRIEFTVTDDMGAVDPSPVRRTIIVKSLPTDLLAPNANISIPIADVEIFVGESVTFNGVVTDNDSTRPFNYFWNFDGAIPNVTRLNPGDVIFQNAGTYRVRFNVTDIDGLYDQTPDERMIIVKPASGVLRGNAAPIGVITSPSANMRVTVGESIEMASMATDSDSNTPLNYRWNMDGVIPNPLTQNPGFVTFSQVGTYRIILTVTDSLGLSDTMPAERIITVVAAQTKNLPPNATIISPAASEDVFVGDSLYFTGSGTDADGNIPLRFYWDFDGVQQNSAGANAGDIVFAREGTYKVSLVAIDSLGAIDMTPAEVTVKVNPAEVVPPVTDQEQAGVAEPNGEITSSSSAILKLNVGDSYTFTGVATDPSGDVDLLMRWNFNGYVPNKIGSSATIKFSQIGQVKVELNVMNSQNKWDVTPAKVTVIIQ